MVDSLLLLFYIDPVTVLPITSLVATVAGVIIFCGKGVVRTVSRWVGLPKSVRRGSPEASSERFDVAPNREPERSAAAAYGKTDRSE